MTAVLAVNGDKLPCGCPASELTVTHEQDHLCGVYPCSNPMCYSRWTCRHHFDNEIVRRTGLKEIPA